MQKYSVPRQIWRMIYPLLMFIGLSEGITAIASIVYVVTSTVQTGMSGDPAETTTALMSFITKYQLWFLTVMLHGEMVPVIEKIGRRNFAPSNFLYLYNWPSCLLEKI